MILNEKHRRMIVIGTVATTVSFISHSKGQSTVPEALGEVFVKGTSTSVTKEDAFIKSKAMSVREVKSDNTQSLDDIVRTVPGAFTNLDKSGGGVNVNIRGLSGFGRVNMTVDGVSQTFYASSADDGGSRGSGTSSFGGLIDPAFIRGVDIERGTFSGKGGVNALMGSADFRTLRLADVIREDNQVGAIANYSLGSNNIGNSYMAAVAAKKNFDNKKLGFIYGYSHRDISQDYKVGDGYGNIKGKEFTFAGYNAAGEPTYIDEFGELWYEPGLPPYNAKALRQKPKSHLAKIEYSDQYNDLVLSYRNYQTGLVGRQIKSDSYQINYHLTSPQNRNVDLNVLYAYNLGKQEYQSGAKIMSLPLQFGGLTTKNTSNTFDVSNTFSNELPFGFLKTTLGVNLLHNEYKKSRHPSELNYRVAKNKHKRGIGALINGSEANTFYPEGEQEFNSVYLDNSLTFGIFTLDANLNWTKNEYRGERWDRIGTGNNESARRSYQRYFGKDFFTNPKYQKILDESFKFNREEFAYEVLQFWDYEEGNSEHESKVDQAILANPDKKYLGYEHISTGRNFKKYEMGEHKYLNHSLGLSAYIHDMFTPFVNYSKTHRSPNIKEIFFSEFDSSGINHLKPENAKTWQLGFNSYRSGLISDQDTFGFKFLVYKTKINDYIHNVKARESRWGSAEPFIKHYNYANKVRIKGLEVELSYDLGRFYLEMAYARQYTNQPLNFTDSSPRVDAPTAQGQWAQGYGLTKLTMLPRDYASLDFGTRWFDQKFILGTKAKYYGESRVTTQNAAIVPCPGTAHGKSGFTHICGYNKEEGVLKKQPIIFDIYAIFKPIKNLQVKAEVQNVFDRAYINPLDANNDSASQFLYQMGVSDDYQYQSNNYARGRTYLVNFNYQF